MGYQKKYLVTTLRILCYKIKRLFFCCINSEVYLRLINNYFLICLGFILFILTYNSLVFLFVLIIYMYYIFMKSRYLFWVTLFLSIIFYLNININKEVDIKTSFKGQVIKVEEKDTYHRLLVISNNSKIIVYDYDYFIFEVGDVIDVNGQVMNIENNRVWNAFNYKEYLRYSNIDYVIQAENLSFIEHKFHINKIKVIVFDYFERNYKDEALVFLKALLLGDDSMFSDDFKDTLKVNGILHLFAISGSHIALFILLLTGAFKKLRFDENKTSFFIIVFLLVYLVITSFSSSILRASLTYFIVCINKKFKLRLSSLDIISILFIILVIFDPFNIYNIGFLLSFMVSSMIIVCSNKFSGGYIKQTFLISLFAAIVTLPVIININYQINMLSPITNVIYVFLVISIILPFSIIVLFCPYLQSVYALVVKGFASTSYIMANYFTLNINIPKMSYLCILIYYGLITLFILVSLKYRKYISIALILFLFIYSNKIYFQNFEVNFIDLYYGESTVIIDHGRVVIIDTGDGRNSELSMYLKSIGVKKIDYLILTHNHDDHNGETNDLINNFQVKKIVVSEFDDSSYANYSSAIVIKEVRSIKLKKINLLFFPPPTKSSNENDNSLIIKISYEGFDMLFTGDATRNSENNYNYGKVDILKVGHHGSSTSTSNELLNMINPNYAVIMTGRIKQFGFPNKEVINRLDEKNIKTYRTDIHYSIRMYIFENKIEFEYLNC